MDAARRLSVEKMRPLATFIAHAHRTLGILSVLVEKVKNGCHENHKGYHAAPNYRFHEVPRYENCAMVVAQLSNRKEWGVFYLLLCYYLHHCRSLSRSIEMRLHFGAELHCSVLAGEKRIVIGAKHIRARHIFRAALTDDNLSDRHFLAVLKLDPEPFGDGITP